MHSDLIGVEQQIVGKVHPQIKAHHSGAGMALRRTEQEVEEVPNPFDCQTLSLSDQAVNLIRRENCVDV